MAGSYSHCVTSTGELRDESFMDLIKNLGDAYEAIQEMYGMIWYLAASCPGRSMDDIVQEAAACWQDGITFSPGVENG